MTLRTAQPRPGLALFLALGLGAACDDPPRTAPTIEASVPAEPAPSPREGCERSGSVESLEGDPTCVTQHASEDAMRAALKSLAITIVPDPEEVVTGGTSLLAVTIKNTASSETTVLLEARSRPVGPRTDWSRVAGIPELRPGGPDVPKVFFLAKTLDSYGHDVDALPTVTTVTGSGVVPGPSPPLVLAVHLRPGAKLVHRVSWWALRIPAPAPIVHDDAGHRYVPKTTALSLSPGEYSVIVDVPFYGLSREERKVTARMKVNRLRLPDGGIRRSLY